MRDYRDAVELELETARDVQGAAQVRLYGALRKGGGPVPTAELAAALDLEASTITRQSIGDIPVPLQTVAALGAINGSQACRVLAPLLYWLAGVCPGDLSILLRDVTEELHGAPLPPRHVSDSEVLEGVADCAEPAADLVGRIIRIIRDHRVDPHERAELQQYIPALIRVLQLGLACVEGTT